MRNYFCALAVCDVDVSLLLQRHFSHAGEANIQDHAPAQNISTGIFQHTIYHYYSQRDVHTDVPCSAAFIQVQIPGYFITNLIKLENVDRYVLLPYSSYKIYLKKIKTKYRQCKFIDLISIKYFVVFNYLEVRSILQHSLIPHNNLTDRDFTEAIFHF